MNNKTLGFAAVAALAIGGGAFYWWRTHHEPASFAILANKSSADRANTANGGETADSTRAPDAGAKTGARVLNPRQRFEQSRDLFALVQELKPIADAGDATAKTLIADAYLECYGVMLDPASRNMGAKLALQKNPSLDAYINELLANQQARCGRFVKSDIGGMSNIMSMYSKAAGSGNAEASAMKLTYSNIDSIPEEELGKAVANILNSGDPDAIAALSGLMGLRAENHAQAFGASSGTIVQQYSWLLAACQMGANCGSNSQMVVGYCLHGGLCGASSVQQVISQWLLSPADYQTAQANSHQIVANLTRGH
ncbi:MAG: hypothetical protein JSS41_11445 [Proteobacteria bacterium]|nr:hypothetical protein [Pseudomonadota bacterium]